MKKIKILNLCCICLMMCLTGCKSSYEKYQKTFLGGFDTLTTYISYAKSEDEFNQQVDFIQEKMTFYNNLFDKYHSYPGINNIYTINQNAGKQPVKVDPVIIDLLEKAVFYHQAVSSKVNIMLGPVLSIWHDFREEAGDGGVGEVPTLEQLQSANQYVDISYLEIDREASTVFITQEGASLDVGAIAKGYAVELVKQGLIDMGVDSFLLSGGGNIAGYGQRKIKIEKSDLETCKTHYCVSIESPKDGAYSDGQPLAMLEVDGKAVVTSGDYQRFYQDIQGIKYHHLVDPDTLYPSVYYRAVTIVTEDSGYADFLSSAAFLTPYEECRTMIESLEGVEAIWLMEDGTVHYSSGLVEGENFHILNTSRLGE